MKNEIQIQQGDVILRRITSAISKEAVIKQKGGKLVLAEGEATGHSHTIVDDDAELILDGERMLLRLEKAAMLKHQEHGPIKIPSGTYEIGQVQEWDYLKGMASPVVD